jgi:hypothetical protein
VILMGMLIFWTGSGDLATWAQAVGAFWAFWAVGIGLRREPVDGSGKPALRPWLRSVAD